MSQKNRMVPLSVLGTAGTASARKVMLCGAGELGKEVAIACQRLGLEVIAVDRYAHAPAMQVAHRSHVLPMLDGAALRTVIEQEQPDWIVPEVEAIATDVLRDMEQQGQRVVPCANAVHTTMNREGIRRLAAERLSLPTSPYRFADSLADVKQAVTELGLPCVIKPVMSSSGKGQTVIRNSDDVAAAWQQAQTAGRAGAGRVIVEGWLAFDYEITLLTVQHAAGTAFCAPIGHVQVDGDYRESWQPHPMPGTVLQQAQAMAAQVTAALGGWGLFGVELFVCGDEVIFSEVSPRPHDTGLVTLAGQDLSEFDLHVRAFLGLPINGIRQLAASASRALVMEGNSTAPACSGITDALALPDTRLLWFAKPEVQGKRRLGVVLARADTVEQARKTARDAAACLHWAGA